MKKVYCTNCNYEFTDHDQGNCPKCGCKYKAFVISIEDKIKFNDEIDAIGHDSQKNIQFEHINRSDENINASLSSDKNKMGFSIESKNRIDKFAEESDHANSFIKIFNEINNSSYDLVEKVAEDYDYPDRIMKSENNFPPKLYIQITHFDSDIIGKLGTMKEFKDKRTFDQLLDNIQKAIRVKSMVDDKIKTDTILLLIIPSPIGQLARQKIINSKIQKIGFREVWISPFHEVPFPIINVA